MPRISLSDLAVNPPKFSPEQRAKLEGLTDEQIVRAAAQDDDAPIWSDEMLERAEKARFIRKLREKLGLSQKDFSEHFEINLATLRDWEQGRSAPNTTIMAYLKVIAYASKIVVLALNAEAYDLDKSTISIHESAAALARYFKVGVITKEKIFSRVSSDAEMTTVQIIGQGLSVRNNTLSSRYLENANRLRSALDPIEQSKISLSANKISGEPQNEQCTTL